MQGSAPRSRTGGRWMWHGGGLAAVVAGGALLLGACGGSGSPSSATTAPSATTAAGGSSTSTLPGGVTLPSTSTPSGGSGASAIAQALQSGETASFDAKYSVSGASSGTTTFEYAVEAPNKYAAIYNGSSGGEVIYNGTNLYYCKTATPVTCQELPAADASVYSGAFEFYTGKFWYQDVSALQAYSGVAGFHESTSTMSVAGQSLNCVTWSGGTSGEASGTVCVTSQGALGYVKAVDAGKTTILTLTSFSTSPPASDFEVPAGATVSTYPAGAQAGGRSSWSGRTATRRRGAVGLGSPSALRRAEGGHRPHVAYLHPPRGGGG
jgi:hypothetical protein